MSSVTSRYPAYVLAGGRSLRFGSDKSRIVVEGQVLIQRLVEQVGATGRPVHVVADTVGRFAELGMKCLQDAQPESGPLAGLVTALEHCQRMYGAGWSVLLSCDLVGWDEAWCESLGKRAEGSCFVSAFSRQQGSGFVPEPMPAMYHTELLDLARRALGSEKRSLSALIVASQWKNSGVSPCAEWSFNTKAELSDALKRLPGA